MIQQDDIIQPVLTGDEVRKAAAFARSMTAPSDTTQPGDYVMAGALAALSKLRAPVAGEAQRPLGYVAVLHGACSTRYFSRITDQHQARICADQWAKQYADVTPGPWPTEAVAVYAAPQASAEPAQPCSCPSGDGSLRHPCAVHPTSATQPEQGERDAC